MNPNHHSIRRNQLIERIENFILNIVRMIANRSNEPMFFNLPNRSIEIRNNNNNFRRPNQRVVRLRRNIRRFTSSILILKVILELLRLNKHTTKRDVYYIHILLFKTQKLVDELLDDFACLFGVPRRHLHVTASCRGVVGGRIQFRERRNNYDVGREFRICGKPISPYIDDMDNISSDADFLLIVEGESTFMRLMEDKFCDRNSCIVVSGKGYPDVATRLFVNKIYRTFRNPPLDIFILTDFDPFGMEIAHIYQFGSIKMYHQRKELATPTIQRIGIEIADFEEFRISERCLIKMNERDMKKAKGLLKREGLSKDLEKEVLLMIEKKVKAEIQSICSISIKFLVDEYLPKKIREKRMKRLQKGKVRNKNVK